MDSNSILSVSLVLYIIATVSFPAYYAQGSTNSDSPCPYGYFYNNTRTTVHPTTTESSTAAHANDSTTLGISPPSLHPSKGTTTDPGCYPCESHTPNCTSCHYSDGYFTCTNCSSPYAQTNGSCQLVSTTPTTSSPPSSSFPIWAIIVIVVVSVIIIIVIIVAVVCIQRKKNPPLPLMPNLTELSQRSHKIPTSGSGTDVGETVCRYVGEPVQTSLERIQSVQYGQLNRLNADNPEYDERIDNPPSAIYGNEDESAIYGNDDVIQKHRNVKEPDVTVDEIYTNEDHGGDSTEELYLNNEDARREVGRGIDNTAYDGGYMNREELDRAKKQAEIAKEAVARSAAKSAQKSRPINTGPSDRGANAADKKKTKQKNNKNPVEHRPRANEPTVQGARDSMFPPGQNGNDQLYGNQEEFAKPRTPAVKEDYGQIYANT